MKRWQELITDTSLENLRDKMRARYYCEALDLAPMPEGHWLVVNKMTVAPDMRVVERAGRYYFEIATTV